MKKLFYFLLVIFPALACEKEWPPATGLEAKIAQLVEPHLVLGQAPGYEIGILKNGSTQFYAFGVQNRETGDPFDEFSIGEIGSITKTFTALWFAQEVSLGRLSLEDSVNTYLPEALRLPSKNGQPIRLIHLLNHTSGLPREPADITGVLKSDQPFDYTADRLADFLKSWQPGHVAGEHFAYSNLGMGLAGYLIQELTDSTYAQQIQSRILQPLQLSHTFCNHGQQPPANVAQGYLGAKPYPFFEMTAIFEGAGCIKSNAFDLMQYLKAAMHPEQTPLEAAFRLAQTPTHQLASTLDFGPETFLDGQIGLGWFTFKNDKGENFYFHNGGTYGFNSFLLFNREAELGVVILSNGGFTGNLNGLGAAIMTLLAEE